MNSRPEFDLLADIARLMRKYGPETFESLAQSLSSPEFSERLATLLVTTSKAGRIARANEVTAKKRAAPARDFRSSLAALSQTEPEKGKLLVEFYDGLVAQSILPSLRDIRAFASGAGLAAVKAHARKDAIIPLVRELMSLPLDELQAAQSAARRTSTQNDRSLEGWSKIILDKSRHER